MVRKLMIIGISLIGFTLALGSNAWADRGRGDRGHRNDKGYHHNYKTPPGHHYGWQKGKGNPHRDRYQHRREYRQRDRDHRWDRDRYRGKHYRDRHHRDRYYRDRHYKGRHIHKRVVEKHVYHHAPKYRRHHDDRFNIAVSVIDEFFGVAVAVSGTR